MTFEANQYGKQICSVPANHEIREINTLHSQNIPYERSQGYELVFYIALSWSDPTAFLSSHAGLSVYMCKYVCLILGLVY